MFYSIFSNRENVFRKIDDKLNEEKLNITIKKTFRIKKYF